MADAWKEFDATSRPARSTPARWAPPTCSARGSTSRTTTSTAWRVPSSASTATRRRRRSTPSYFVDCGGRAARPAQKPLRAALRARRAAAGRRLLVAHAVRAAVEPARVPTRSSATCSTRRCCPVQARRRTAASRSTAARVARAGKGVELAARPAGPFSALLRLYLPKKEALDGTWKGAAAAGNREWAGRQATKRHLRQGHAGDLHPRRDRPQLPQLRQHGGRRQPLLPHPQADSARQADGGPDEPGHALLRGDRRHLEGRDDHAACRSRTVASCRRSSSTTTTTAPAVVLRARDARPAERHEVRRPWRSASRSSIRRTRRRSRS